VSNQAIAAHIVEAHYRRVLAPAPNVPTRGGQFAWSGPDPRACARKPPYNIVTQGVLKLEVNTNLDELSLPRSGPTGAGRCRTGHGRIANQHGIRTWMTPVTARLIPIPCKCQPSPRPSPFREGSFVLLLVDFVAKVENRTTPKISRKVIFREL
jgi:hypothetical protein